MSMSNYLGCRAKLKKRVKIKGQLASANDMTFLPGTDHSRLIASDHRGGRLVVFQDDRRTGKEILGGVRPYGVASIDSRTVVFVDENLTTGGLIKRFSIEDEFGSTGRVVSQWDNNGNGSSSSNPDTWRPRGVTVTKSGQIVVTNVHPDAQERLYMFSGDAGGSTSFGRANGPGDLVFRCPNYVTADEIGRVLATDAEGNCVKVFDPRSRYVSEFGHGGGGQRDKDAQLTRPAGIACDQRSNIIVCDSGNRRLAMFSQDGRFIQNLRPPLKMGLYTAGVAVNPSADRLSLSVHDTGGNLGKLLIYDYICG